MGRPFFAYMLLCADGSFYVGQTDDLEKRIDQHEAGVGCAYTAKRLPVRLAWSQEFGKREEAKEAEARLKGWSRAKKQALIRNDFESVSALAKKQDWVSYRERRIAEKGEGEGRP